MGASFADADMREVDLDKAIESVNFAGSALRKAYIPEIALRLKGSLFDSSVYELGYLSTEYPYRWMRGLSI